MKLMLELATPQASHDACIRRGGTRRTRRSASTLRRRIVPLPINSNIKIANGKASGDVISLTVPQANRCYPLFLPIRKVLTGNRAPRTYVTPVPMKTPEVTPAIIGMAFVGKFRWSRYDLIARQVTMEMAPETYEVVRTREIGPCH